MPNKNTEASNTAVFTCSVQMSVIWHIQETECPSKNEGTSSEKVGTHCKYVDWTSKVWKGWYF